MCARHEKRTSREYFLAGDRLPWYAIGGSLTSSNISAEHFVGMIGYAYAAGLVVANLEWGNWYTYSLLVWIFLPYYMRSGLYTMPEFLERRFNRTTRYLYAVTTLLTYVLGFIAAILYAGAVVLEALFGLPPVYGVLLMAVTTAVYTIYGGLLSVVWTDFLQFIILFAGGITVTLLGLDATGGLGPLLCRIPGEIFHGLSGGPSGISVCRDGGHGAVGQHVVCLHRTSSSSSAIWERKSEWDARMGAIFAGYMKLLLPFIICLPGVIAYKVLGPGVDPNHVFALLVARLVPAGLMGLIMAGLASAIMSTISSALNSAGTVATLDLIVPLWKKDSSDEEQVRWGKWLSAVFMAVAVGFAIMFSVQQGQVFLIIQNIYAYFAAPVAALFLLGIFWKGATGTAATVTFIAGFTLNELVDRVLFKLEPFTHYNSFYNRATIVFALSLLILWSVSLFTKKTPAGVVDAICWRPSDLRLRGDGRSRHGTASLVAAWALMAGSILAVYAALGVFQWVKS